MEPKQLYDMMYANAGFHLATIEDGKPRVRGMHLFQADEAGIVFHTYRPKPVYQQLAKNPEVEMCFNDFSKGLQVRVHGQLEELHSPELKQTIIHHPTRGYLKPWLERGGSLEDLRVFRLSHGVAEVWTMATNFDPKTFIQL